ncbi:MAG TPA: HAMP domain-containing sensor histidine kinase [Jatrophihabitans sp.]|uniref:sensor histidine kinase n=1 Tax=Jatrophihabitans sp. TaxID=1932789 RepID=UPI002DF92503|nr:HAMP domain-containing sensor histidine kinase [Jatrophihabitans sp.]
MRRRIVRLAVLSAALSLLLFGVPLATGTSYYLQLRDRDELTRLAYAVASAASDNVSTGVSLVAPPRVGHSYQVGLYDRRARLVSGHAQADAIPLVRSALGGTVSTRNDSGALTVAIPVRDNDVIVGVVVAHRARDAHAIVLGWLLLAALAVVVLAVTLLVARRIARRVAAPLERLAQQADLLASGPARRNGVASGIAEVDAVDGALTRAATRLDALLERERQFAAAASHQLRTPLTRLSLTLEGALESDDPRHEIDRALAIVSHLDNTVTDVLHLSRGETTAEMLQLDRLLADVEARWTAAVHDPSRSLTCIRGGDAPEVRTSGRAVRQILDVLLDNAIEHGRGAVRVVARGARGALAIDVVQESSVKDGSVEAFLAGGAGLGLRYARSIAETHGARLVVSGTVPVTFTLVMPAS